MNLQIFRNKWQQGSDREQFLENTSFWKVLKSETNSKNEKFEVARIEAMFFTNVRRLNGKQINCFRAK